MKKTILALVLAAGLTSFAGSAKAGLTFDWSFAGSGDYDSSAGTVAGVVTLNEAGTQARSIYITSAPIAYDAAFNWVSVVSYGGINNSFTLSDSGLVQNAVFVSYDYNSLNGLNFNHNSYSNYYLNGAESSVFNGNGMAGITFTPATDTAPVPEPSQVAASILLIGGIAGFVIIRRRKESALALAA